MTGLLLRSPGIVPGDRQKGDAVTDPRKDQAKRRAKAAGELIRDAEELEALAARVRARAVNVFEVAAEAVDEAPNPPRKLTGDEEAYAFDELMEAPWEQGDVVHLLLEMLQSGEGPVIEGMREGWIEHIRDQRKIEAEARNDERLPAGRLIDPNDPGQKDNR